MPASTRDDNSSAKRKRDAKPTADSESSKRSRTKDAPPANPALIGPHKAMIAELAPKYDILPASVISSTQIRKRVTSIAQHLLSQTDKPRVVLLHARTRDVCKLITVVEQCKRVIVEEGKPWYQYNQLFDEPERPKKRDVVEETILQNEAEDDSDSDDFEVMHSRFEDAVLPPPSNRTVKSMRLFVSVVPVPELKSKGNTTMQSSEERKT
ncbi:hypothetical protein B0T10DRAFT_12326 [Thelonectria olida]|uniref:DNA/RNA-binding protein Alba-like domain-containing protein n=1 Tax=Thelonectria olida TaxID=1576542 RepID=A0A9P8WK92_9HYPO|nr:hypothetical protein B0T10DRAFT_12326 [Thelonectria olida]